MAPKKQAAKKAADKAVEKKVAAAENPVAAASVKAAAKVNEPIVPEMNAIELVPAADPNAVDPSVTPDELKGSRDLEVASDEKQQAAPVDTALQTRADAKTEALDRVQDVDALDEEANEARQAWEDARLDVSDVRTAGGWAAGVSPTGQRTFTSPADGLNPSGHPQINSPAEGVSVIARPEDPLAVPEGTQPVRYDHAPFVQANPNGEADNDNGPKEFKPMASIKDSDAAAALGWRFEEDANGEINVFRRAGAGEGMVEFHAADEKQALERVQAWENHDSRRAVEA